MSTHRTYYLLRRLKDVRYTYFIVIFIVAAGLFVYASRQNNLRAIYLRDRLMQVDKDNGDVSAALNDLREFTYGHMNANLSGGPNGIYPPIQLKYTYERLVAAENARVNSANSQLYTEAQAHCEAQVTSRVTINRVPCIQEYLSTHGTIQMHQVPDALYKFDFASPVWSPDLAGWSVVVAAVALIALISRVVLELWLRHRLRS